MNKLQKQIDQLAEYAKSKGFSDSETSKIVKEISEITYTPPPTLFDREKLEEYSLEEQIINCLKFVNTYIKTDEVNFLLRLSGNWKDDTFDIRDAVSNLVRDGRCKFTHPGYYLTLCKEI